MTLNKKNSQEKNESKQIGITDFPFREEEEEKSICTHILFLRLRA